MSSATLALLTLTSAIAALAAWLFRQWLDALATGRDLMQQRDQAVDACSEQRERADGYGKAIHHLIAGKPIDLEMQRVWAVSVFAIRTMPGLASTTVCTQHAVGVAVGCDGAEAERLAVGRACVKWPEADGWRDHSACAQEVLPSHFFGAAKD